MCWNKTIQFWKHTVTDPLIRRPFKPLFWVSAILHAFSLRPCDLSISQALYFQMCSFKSSYFTYKSFMTMLKETLLLIGLSPNDYDTHSFCWEEVGSLMLCIYIYICLYDSEFLPSSKSRHIYHPIVPTPKILHYTTLLDFGHISAGFSVVLFSVLHCLFFTYSVFMQCSFAYLLHTTIRSLSLYIYLQHFGFLHFCR